MAGTSAFDIVVVGAGSSGSVVAARASEDAGRSVCLVEAGPDYPALETLPFDLINSHNNSYTAHDWGFDYQPTPTGRSASFPRGRVSGGSSAVNTTIALRGMPEDYDGWAELGNPEWAWDRVLPAFRRLERDIDFGHEPFHGDAGPITIRRYPREEMTLVHQAFLDASRELGYPDCADANDPAGWGAGPHPMNKIGRLRVSTAVGYLSAARARPNLEIRSNTHARRVLLSNGRATGVEVERNGEVEILSARLVVLCAGALQTPPILYRSGVGPRAALERLGIEVVDDVPGVAENLRDHPALAVLCRVKDPSILDADQPIVQTILRYTAEGSAERNDLQIEAFSFSPRGGRLDCFAIAAVLEEVKGTGSLRITSADPHAKPIAEPRFLEDERDLVRLAGAFRDTVAFTRAAAYRDIIDEVLFPDPARDLPDEALFTMLRKRASSGYHPCGTAKMGPVTDPMAVVDQFGRLHVVEGLAVADASIMPSVPRANTNLTTIMIGEMVGEWLRTRPAAYGF